MGRRRCQCCQCPKTYCGAYGDKLIDAITLELSFPDPLRFEAARNQTRFVTIDGTTYGYSINSAITELTGLSAWNGTYTSNITPAPSCAFPELSLPGPQLLTMTHDEYEEYIGNCGNGTKRYTDTESETCSLEVAINADPIVIRIPKPTVSGYVLNLFEPDPVDPCGVNVFEADTVATSFGPSSGTINDCFNVFPITATVTYHYA